MRAGKRLSLGVHSIVQAFVVCEYTCSRGRRAEFFQGGSASTPKVNYRMLSSCLVYVFRASCIMVYGGFRRLLFPNCSQIVPNLSDCTWGEPLKRDTWDRLSAGPLYMYAPRALGFVPSRVFMLYRGDSRNQVCSTKKRPVFRSRLKFWRTTRVDID
jgi:hypothetical protein